MCKKYEQNPTERNRKKGVIMQKSTQDIFKEMWKVILAYVVLSGIITAVLDLGGLGLTAAIDPADFAGGFQFDPSMITGMIPALLTQFVVNLVLDMVSLGIFLAIYRNKVYDTQVEFADIFYFFNGEAPKTVLALILKNILSLIGLVLFLVPGIVFSIAMIPFGVVAGLIQVHGEMEVWGSIKKTWETSKGYKGLIFGRVLIAAILSGVIGGIVGLLTILAPEIFVPQPGKAIMNLIVVIVTGMIYYVVWIDLIREMTERGAFRLLVADPDRIEKAEQL